MNNPLQEQLLKAGLVNKKQVKKANQEKTRSQKKQRQNKKAKPDNQVQLKIQQAAKEKVKRDQALNQKKQEQAKQKAVSAEIDQLITNNLIARDESCDITYNFEHRKKINRIYINTEMRQSIAAGKQGIARIDGRYEVVPLSIAEKIKQRNPKRIILFETETTEDTINKEDDPYADYQIPDDLTW